MKPRACLSLRAADRSVTASACSTIKYIFGNDIHIISRRPTKLDECRYMKMHITAGEKKVRGLESSSAPASENSRDISSLPFPDALSLHAMISV